MEIEFREKTEVSELLDFSISEGYINSEMIEINDYDMLRRNYNGEDNSREIIGRLSLLVEKPSRLVWLYDIMYCLSLEDFSNLLGDMWTNVEFPNLNSEMIPEYIEMFKLADKCELMYGRWDEEFDEYEKYQSLPEEVTVYRGCVNNPEGLSWTLDIKVARWFANRFSQLFKGEVYQAIVKKENILACFSRWSEKEIIVDTQAIKNTWSIIKD